MRSKSKSVIGPIVGGFVVENPHLGWHFNFWLMFIFSAITLVAGYCFTPETVNLIFSLMFQLLTQKYLVCAGPATSKG
jgi:MFS family permease